MSLITTKDKFHLALNGIGLLLQGAPDRPAYVARNAPVYGTRFASGDRDYNDLSQWWYFIQTDWSGGFKDSQSWEDDAKYYYSQNIDAFSRVGGLQLMRAPATMHQFSETIRSGIQTSINAGVITTAWKNPSTYTQPNTSGALSFATLGYGNWSNPANVYSSDNSNATAAQGGTKITHWHGFGFSIPTGATITGVEVRIEGKQTSTPNGYHTMYAMIGKTMNSVDTQPSAIGGVYSRTFPASGVLTGSDVVMTRGGTSDLWGNTFTAAEINASTFGVKAEGSGSASPTTEDYAIDEIAIRVSYRLAASSNAIYIGTGDEGAGGQPIVYNYDGSSWNDISTSNYTNSNRTAFVHLKTPLGVLNIHSMTSGDDTSNVLALWDGATWTDITSYIAGTTSLSVTPSSSRASAVYGGVNYIFVDNPDAGYALISHTKAIPTASSDFTLKFQNFRSNEAPIAACEKDGSIYYLVAKSISSGIYYSALELRQYDIANSVDVLVKEFKGVYGRCDIACAGLLVNTGVSLLITIPYQEVWEIKSGILSRIYKTDAIKKFIGGVSGNPGEIYPSLNTGCVMIDNRAWWGNLVYDPVQGYFYQSFKGDDAAIHADNLINPFFNDLNDVLYFSEWRDETILQTYNINDDVYKTGEDHTAFLVFSNHDKLQSIDKLLNMVSLGFEPFNEGEGISLYYSTLPNPSSDIGDWTLIDSASYSEDGGTVVSKNLLLPDGTTGKKIWFRVELFGDGTSTPTLTDLTLEYLPMPDYRKSWELVVNCSDEVKTLAGRHQEVTARELHALLERAWYTKAQLDFQDLNFAQTTLSADATVYATAWKNPSTYTQPDHNGASTFASVGYGNWTNPANVYASDNTNATAIQGGVKVTHWHGFDLGVPLGATIVGVEVRIEGKTTSTVSGQTLFAKIGKTMNSTDTSNAGINGTSAREFPSSGGLTGSDVAMTRGGSSDLWGNTFTVDEINASTFGVKAEGNTSSSPTTTDYAIDEIAIRAYYTVDGITESNTTINVANTDDFPEQGRIKIDDEEIFYTSKTRTSFVGCTRGARGTKAINHNHDSVVHNAYKILVMGIEFRTPVLLEGKNLEYTFQLSLREV